MTKTTFQSTFKNIKNYYNHRLGKRARMDEGIIEGIWYDTYYEISFYLDDQLIDRFYVDSEALAKMNVKEYVKRKNTYRIISLN